MQDMLGGEFSDFEACMLLPHLRGIRVNTLKLALEKSDWLGLPIRRCPFSECGFYLDSDDWFETSELSKLITYLGHCDTDMVMLDGDSGKVVIL